ncbi:MAG: S41 family peptidase [Paramuribaculum sp.]|nr:S41 family peptidase [Paramuribaculum sp.]
MKRNSLFLSLLALMVVLPAFADNMKFTPRQKLGMVENIIENFYVDSVNADHMVEEAIIAMLKTLDPHSQYSDKEETKALTEPLQGNFSGIGIQFNMLNDTLYVIQPVAGGPSEKVGILAGDRIIAADDTAISGMKMKNSAIQKILRGPKGSVVKVTVLRKGVSEFLEFNIVRDDIPIYSIDAAYMVNDSVGFIKLTRFAESSGREMAEAVGKLKRKGMKRLVLDLEENGGGYLSAAFDVASMFLNKGDLVVYTQGSKMEPHYFRAERDGMLADMPVVVMVNQYSASASEIVSGAIQDNDRGVITGRRTFGKGLVQRPFPLPDGSMVRLTIQRYYTPSGRCIQKPYAEGKDEEYRNETFSRLSSGELMNADSIHIPNSLLYRTLRLGRPVYGGGGVIPDNFVPVDTSFYSAYYRDLVAKGLINRVATEYVDEHRKELRKKYRNETQFVEQFAVTESILQHLIDLGTKDGVVFNQEQYDTSRPIIELIIKGIIGRDIFEQSTYFRVVNPISPNYREAVRIISSPQAYLSYLSVPQQ